MALILRSYMTRLRSQLCEINVLFNCVFKKKEFISTLLEKSKVRKYRSVLKYYVLANIGDIRAISK